MTLKTKVEKLEDAAIDRQRNGEAAKIERPDAVMFAPVGVEISPQHLAKLEADERTRQNKPDGFIFVPYQPEML